MTTINKYILQGVLLLTPFKVAALDSKQQEHALEEVVITAERREQSLQASALSVSVLGQQQLEMQGVSSLGNLIEGAIPSLRVQPLGSVSTNLVVAIRGNGAADGNEVTREASIATYLDGVYLGRSHGLGMELIDLKRIEVLRGPQGTLFGRNAIGGAINLVSHEPTGEFGFKQTIGIGRYDELRSVTRLNLPEYSNIKLKFDYFHSERDGWVNNTAPGQPDYAAYDKDGGQLSALWQASDSIDILYRYDKSEVESTQNYFQFYVDNLGLFGEERDRRTTTRRPVIPLEPSILEQEGHAITATWSLNDNLTIKSISSYRDLDEKQRNNFAGTLYFNGANITTDSEQDQFSQEFQLIGSSKRVDWVAGLYYFDEDVRQTAQNYFTLDIFGIITGTPFEPIVPPTILDVLGVGGPSPRKVVNAEADSLAAYGQLTWTPDILANRLHLTAGLRHTDDERSGDRAIEAERIEFSNDWQQTDYAFTVNYEWTDTLSTYVRWATAYKAGGANSKSVSFIPYDEEEAESLELGLKSEFWNRRARLNIALFQTDYDGMQLDFAVPGAPDNLETINAQKTVEVDGAEVDFTIIPLAGLLIGLNYSYLDGDMPLQPNPLANNAPREFVTSQTPQHAGSFTVDYTIGSITAHIDVTSTDQYAYVPHGLDRRDGYTLVNARLSIADIRFGEDTGTFNASIWGRNLTDKEYVVYSVPIGDPIVSIPQAFGTPRTFGIDFTYEL